MSITSSVVPKGFDFPKEVWMEYVKENRPLVVVPFMSKMCNINCVYCMMKEDRISNKFNNMLTFEEQKRVLKECADLGCKTMVITGIGEPFMDPAFYDPKTKTFPIVEYAQSLGMYTIVFTNGYFINEEIAQKLFKLKISLILKMSSLNEKVFSEMNGCPIKFEDYFENEKTIRIPKYLKCLFEAGFGGEPENNATRLISDLIITKMNINEIPDVMKFSFDHNMLVCLDPLVVKSSARDNFSQLGITNEENRTLYKHIKKLFSSYDMNMFDLSNCIIHHNGFVYDLEGNVRRCLSVPANIGNVRNFSVKELWLRSLRDKKLATQKYESVKFVDIFGKCPGRCFYSGIHN